MKNDNRMNKYSEKVQNEIIETLKAYDECHVERHGTEYRVCTGWCLKAQYGDEEVLDTFKADDLFTEDDKIINYMESFHDYKITYKGKRDYKMIHEIEGNWEARFAFDENGNIVRIA